MSRIRLDVLAPVMLALAVLAGACSATDRNAHLSSTTRGVEHPPATGGTIPVEGDRLDQWTVNAASPAVGADYSLSNTARGAVLFFAAGPNGLDWDGYSHKEWSFRKTSSSPFLAIYNKQAGKYLVAGTNVVMWTFAPSYQWSWSATTGNRIALYNAVKQDYLMSDIHSVPFGQVNWKYHPTTLPTTHDATVTMTAQPPVQGYVPFLGYFGGGPGNNAVLIEVRNPQTYNVPLFFIKPGHSSNECGLAGATLYLAPGAALTEEQMTTLWGSPRPSLSTKRAFLACAATTISSAFVNVKYEDI